MFRSKIDHLNTRIMRILEAYKNIANQDPLTLKQAIAPHEVWRFFIDGHLQTGRGLADGDFFKNKAHLDLTVKEYIEQQEKITLTNEEDYHISPLWQFLNNKQWRLTPSECALFSLQDLLALDRGWLPFEVNEPGYIKALLQAYQMIFNFSVDVDQDFIKGLHRLATAGVQHTEYEDGEDDKPGEYRKAESAYFRFGDAIVTKNAFEQILTQENSTARTHSSSISINLSFFNQTDGLSIGAININHESIAAIKKYIEDLEYNKENGITDYHFPLRKYCDSHDILTFISEIKNNPLITDILMKLGKKENISEIAQYLAQLISTPSSLYSFNLESCQPNKPRRTLTDEMKKSMDACKIMIDSAGIQQEKLLAIIRHIQYCERLHPFIDGNTRTFTMLYMNHLLLRHGFPPVILDNPNKMGTSSDKEALALVLDGMENSLRLAKGEKLFGVETNKILAFLSSRPHLNDKLAYFKEVIAIEEKTHAAKFGK